MENLKSIQNVLVNRVTSLGETRHVSGRKVRELINLPLEIPGYHTLPDLPKNQQKYVDDKIIDYLGQIERCYEILGGDRTSRQAVVQFDTTGSLPNCMVSVSFQIRKGKLYANVLMRSWDVKNKFFQDYAIISTMMKMIASELDSQIGGAVILIANAHYYL